MKKQLTFILIALLLVQCGSIQKYNANLTKPIAVEKLKKDVSFAQKRLEKMHPNLYYYISKKELDRKFDSIKSTITSPMTSLE
jgi:uncharacterized protein YcfL